MFFPVDFEKNDGQCSRSFTSHSARDSIFSHDFEMENPGLSKIGGWKQLVFGFGLLFFGAVFDFTDNFPGLEQWVIIGETPVQVFLEEMGAYLLGSLLLTVGLYRWIPSVIGHNRQTKERLERTAAEIKTLSGLLPICSSYEKNREDKGYWSQIEGYISAHSEATFSHSICPDCSKKLYPDINIFTDKKS